MSSGMRAGRSPGHCSQVALGVNGFPVPYLVVGQGVDPLPVTLDLGSDILILEDDTSHTALAPFCGPQSALKNIPQDFTPTPLQEQSSGGKHESPLAVLGGKRRRRGASPKSMSSDLGRWEYGMPLYTVSSSLSLAWVILSQLRTFTGT
jgi:hypothetical protein